MFKWLLQTFKHRAIKTHTGIRKTILYQDLNNIKQVLNNLNGTLKISNRNKTSQNKITGLTVVLLYMHIFYTLMIQLQHVHVTSKNFMSDRPQHIILLLLFNVL